jgi:hypothetical protein
VLESLGAKMGPEDVRSPDTSTGNVDATLGSGSELSAALPPGLRSRSELRVTLLAMAADVLSGPGGLASVLRTGTPGMPFPSVSLGLGEISRRRRRCSA